MERDPLLNNHQPFPYEGLDAPLEPVTNVDWPPTREQIRDGVNRWIPSIDGRDIPTPHLNRNTYDSEGCYYSEEESEC